uniref:HPL n=1 Tax=Arundo donax TaxID=35708 RepID=A0A0A8XP25_ARUDO
MSRLSTRAGLKSAVNAAASTTATTRGSMPTKKGKVGGMLARNTVLRCAAARRRKNSSGPWNQK